MKSPSTRGLGFMARIDPGCTRGMLIWQKEAHLAIHGGDGSTLRASAPSCGRQGRRTSSVGLQRPPFVLDRPMRGRSDPRRTRTILHHTFETNSSTNGPERARWHPRVLGPRTVWTAVFSGKERSSTGVASCDVGTDTCLFPGPKGKPASNAPLRRDETSPSRTELSCVPPSPARVPPFRPARTCLLSCVLIGPFENRGRRTAVRKASNRPPAVPLPAFSPKRTSQRTACWTSCFLIGPIRGIARVGCRGFVPPSHRYLSRPIDIFHRYLCPPPLPPRPADVVPPPLRSPLGRQSLRLDATRRGRVVVNGCFLVSIGQKSWRVCEEARTFASALRARDPSLARPVDVARKSTWRGVERGATCRMPETRRMTRGA